MIELGIDFNEFFEKNKKLITAQKTISRLYEAYDSTIRDPIREDLYSALISLQRVLWLKFSFYASDRGAFSFCNEVEAKKVGIELRKKFEFHFPRPTPIFCNPEYRKALKRRQRKQGDQGE